MLTLSYLGQNVSARMAMRVFEAARDHTSLSVAAEDTRNCLRRLFDTIFCCCSPTKNPEDVTPTVRSEVKDQMRAAAQATFRHAPNMLGEKESTPFQITCEDGKILEFMLKEIKTPGSDMLTTQLLQKNQYGNYDVICELEGLGLAALALAPV